MTKLEYIWIDGTEPTAQLRSKTKVIEPFYDRNGIVDGISNIKDCPVWGFDGSSTNQAPGNNSDCVLKPVRLYKNPLEDNCYLVLCEVFDTNEIPILDNHRFKLENLYNKYKKEDVWVGIEQEYTLYKDGKPYGWPKDGEPAPQGD